VRPTTDRVREATFNALGSLGGVTGTTVLDLFAGSGAMGIEALSRGAVHCTFVDASRRALDAVRSNLHACRLAGQAEVVRGDAIALVEAGALAAPGGGRFDVAVLDPPYDFHGWAALLGALPAALAVIESGGDVELPEGWEMVRHRRYGTSVVAIARRTAGAAGHHEDPVGRDEP
jgi:16S rRNA (guanine966-N2)-methyltransferase